MALHAHLFQAILVQMEKENDEALNKNSAFESEMGMMHSELSELRNDKLKLEKELLRHKREVYSDISSC